MLPKIYVERIRFFDGDYDDAGLYWGNTDKIGIFLFHVWLDDENEYSGYFRATSGLDALQQFHARFLATDLVDAR